MCSIVALTSYELKINQTKQAEAGNLVYMEDGIDMDTNTGGGMGNMFRRWALMTAEPFGVM